MARFEQFLAVVFADPVGFVIHYGICAVRIFEKAVYHALYKNVFLTGSAEYDRILDQRETHFTFQHWRGFHFCVQRRVEKAFDLGVAYRFSGVFVDQSRRKKAHCLGVHTVCLDIFERAELHEHMRCRTHLGGSRFPAFGKIGGFQRYTARDGAFVFVVLKKSETQLRDRDLGGGSCCFGIVIVLPAHLFAGDALFGGTAEILGRRKCVSHHNIDIEAL